jgi:predicted neutral ceramidase superfamily lipid hydrolase
MWSNHFKIIQTHTHIESTTEVYVIILGLILASDAALYFSMYNNSNAFSALSLFPCLVSMSIQVMCINTSDLRHIPPFACVTFLSSPRLIICEILHCRFLIQPIHYKLYINTSTSANTSIRTRMSTRTDINISYLPTIICFNFNFNPSFNKIIPSVEIQDE